MKTLKPILFSIILSLLFTFCANSKIERDNKTKNKVNFTNAELIGKWNQVIDDNDSNIKSIQLINDSVAKIHLIDSTGYFSLMGKWESKFEKKVRSDIKITYYYDKQTIQILLLEVSEENNKLIITGNNLKFEKE